MKNLANYLDDFMNDDEFEFESRTHKIGDKYTIGSKEDMIKANRKAAREEEIAAHGHSVNLNYTFKNKKTYSRKNKHKKQYT